MRAPTVAFVIADLVVDRAAACRFVPRSAGGRSTGLPIGALMQPMFGSTIHATELPPHNSTGEPLPALAPYGTAKLVVVSFDRLRSVTRGRLATLN